MGRSCDRESEFRLGAHPLITEGWRSDDAPNLVSSFEPFEPFEPFDAIALDTA